MTTSSDVLINDEVRIGRNDLLALTALIIIMTVSVLLPYAFLTHGVRGPVIIDYVPGAAIFVPGPLDSFHTIPVYLLSGLTYDSPYSAYSEVVHAVRAYSIAFLLLAQVMAILHMSVGSGRMRPAKGLLLSVMVAVIWVFLCHVVFGYLSIWYLVQRPFVPLLNTVLMVFYREEG